MGDWAFSDCSSLTKIEFPNATEIGNYAFNNCNALSNFEFPMVTIIGERAFSSCCTLTTIEFPMASFIGENAFSGCEELVKVTLPRAQNIGKEAFIMCQKLATVNIQNATSIGKWAFNSCASLENVTMTYVTEIGEGAFGYCPNLKSASLPRAKTISRSAFNGCYSLSSVELSAVESIEEGAFNQCTSLRSAVMPKVSDISQYAFSGCESLERVKMPEVYLIGKGVFAGCEKLSSIMLGEEPPVIIADTFDADTYKTATLYVPEWALTDYKSNTLWKKFAHIDKYDPEANTVETEIEYMGMWYKLQETKNGTRTAKPIKPTDNPDFVFTGVVYINYEVPYNGDIYYTQVLSSGTYGNILSNSKVTELHFGEGFTNIDTYLVDMPELRGVYLPSTINSYAPRIIFTRCDKVYSSYVIADDEYVWIKLERFNIYGPDGNKLTPFMQDENPDSARYYADNNGIFGPYIRNRNAIEMLWLLAATNVYTLTIPYVEINGTRINMRNNAPHHTTGNKFFVDGIRYDIIPDGNSVCVSRDIIDCDYRDEISIPESVNHNGKTYPVTHIAQWAFKDKPITKITIPSSVKYIGYEKSWYNDKNYHGAPEPTMDNYSEAFQGCTELKSVQLSEGLLGIGAWAFEGCSSLESIKLPSTLKYLGDGVFSGCKSLESIEFPHSLEYIGTFNSCSSLEKVIFRENVILKWNNYFRSCPSLRAIFMMQSEPQNIGETTFDESVFALTTLYVPIGSKEKYQTATGWNKFKFIKEVDPSKIDEVDIHEIDKYLVTVDGMSIFCNYNTGEASVIGVDDILSANVTVPSKVVCPADGKSYPVTTVAYKAFASNRTIESVSMPEITVIGASAFASCGKLKSASAPKATSVGASAFYCCITLSDISLPNATELGSSSFYWCDSLTKVSFPKVETINSSAFYICLSLTDVEAPLATTIGQSAFYSCNSLVEISLPNVTMIGSLAFSGCSSLQSISFPSVTSIESSTFDGCKSLREISIPNVTKIGYYAFYRCTSLVSISLPSVTEISNYNNGSAFSGCTSLEYVSMPCVNSIGYKTFINCPALKVISLGTEEPPYAGYNWTNNWPSEIDLSSIPFDSEILETATLMVPAEYKSSYSNHEFWRLFKNIVEIDQTPQQLEYGGLRYRLNIDGETVSVCGFADRSANNPEDVYIPASVTYGNTEYAVTEICEYAFAYEVIKTVQGMKNVTTIGEHAFEKCYSLSDISMPAVQYINYFAFDSCMSLLSIYAPEVKEINGGFLYKCWLRHISIPKAKILNGMYRCCDLEDIYVGETPATVDGDFHELAYENATVYVPIGSLEAYKQAPVWKNFYKIVEYDPAGIYNPTVDDNDFIFVYDLQGIERYRGVRDEMPELPRGIYIIRHSNGTTEKVAL